MVTVGHNYIVCLFAIAITTKPRWFKFAWFSITGLITCRWSISSCLNCGHIQYEKLAIITLPLIMKQTKVMKTAQYPSAPCGMRVMIKWWSKSWKWSNFLEGIVWYISVCPPGTCVGGISISRHCRASRHHHHCHRHRHRHRCHRHHRQSSFLSPPMSSSLGHRHHQIHHCWRLRGDFHIYVHHFQHLSLVGLSRGPRLDLFLHW